MIRCFAVEPQSFFVGNNPNSALSFIAHAKGNDQTLDDRSADIIEIVKVTARIREKLRGVTIQGHSARAEASGSRPAHMSF